MKVHQLYSYGSSIRITKDSPNYCKKCVYKILLSTEEETSAFFIIRVLNKVINLSGGVNFWLLMFQELPAGEKRCYSLDVPDSKVNENLIVHTSIFSGSLDLKYYPGGLDDEKSIISFNPQLYNEIKITPEQRKINNINSNICFICLIAKRDTSYSFTMVFENEIENSQSYIFITKGKIYYNINY